MTRDTCVLFKALSEALLSSLNFELSSACSSFASNAMTLRSLLASSRSVPLIFCSLSVFTLLSLFRTQTHCHFIENRNQQSSRERDSLEFFGELIDARGLLDDPVAALPIRFAQRGDALVLLLTIGGELLDGPRFVCTFARELINFCTEYIDHSLLVSAIVNELLDCLLFALATVGELVDGPRFASTFSLECSDRVLFASTIVGEFVDACLQLVNVALVVDGCGSGRHRAVGEEEAREAHFVDNGATLRTMADREEAALVQPASDTRLVEDVTALARRYGRTRLEMLHANYALSLHFD